MGIKKGDLVEIVGSAEESKYKGCIFTVTSDPYTIPSGPEIVKMECPEINKRFGGGYSTEFLRVVKEISIQNESNVEAAIEKIEELRSAGSLEHSDYGYLHDLLTGIDVQSAPRYSPVKPEDITDGYYWLVGPDGEKMVDRVVWKYTVGGAEDVHVNDLAEAGFTFYRIPDLEVAE